METIHTEQTETPSRILRYLQSKQFGVLSAFTIEDSNGESTTEKHSRQQRARNLEMHWKLKNTLRDRGYGVVMLEAEWEEKENFYSALYFFVPGLTIDEAIALGHQFDQRSVVTNTDNGDLVLASTESDIDTGKILRTFSKMNLPEYDFVDAFTGLVEHSRGNEKINYIVIDELTRVPLHCSTQLEYPYFRCYTFQGQDERKIQ